jgi:hypothetical protein
MDWKDIGGVVAPFAPTIGKVIGGLIPLPGASLGGELLGGMIARQFGVEATPEAVNHAIRNAPPDVAAEKLAAAEAEAQAKWPALAEIAKAEAADRTAQAQAINETIRAEVAAGVSWWHWRHLMGYATLLWAVAVLPPFVLAMWKADVAALTAITTALTSAIPFFAILAGFNGYIAQDSTRLKTTAITGEHAPSVTTTVDKVVKAVKRK